MESTLGLVGTIFGSALFGAIIGKLLDAFLLTKINSKIEKNRWLRQAKLEEFSKLSKELSSLCFENKIFDDEYMLNSIASGTILLIDDKTLVTKIQNFIKEIIDFSTSKYPEILKTQNQNEVKLPSGQMAGEKELMIGFHVKDLITKAFAIINDLSNDLKNT